MSSACKNWQLMKIFAAEFDCVVIFLFFFRAVLAVIELYIIRAAV